MARRSFVIFLLSLLWPLMVYSQEVSQKESPNFWEGLGWPTLQQGMPKAEKEEKGKTQKDVGATHESPLKEELSRLWTEINDLKKRQRETEDILEEMRKELEQLRTKVGARHASPLSQDRAATTSNLAEMHLDLSKLTVEECKGCHGDKAKERSLKEGIKTSHAIHVPMMGGDCHVCHFRADLVNESGTSLRRQVDIRICVSCHSGESSPAIPLNGKPLYIMPMKP